jgi:hypothetical protein
MRLVVSGWKLLSYRFMDLGVTEQLRGDGVNFAFHEAKYCSKVEDLRAKR